MAKPAVSPLLTLSNGKTIPIFGLGTWKSKPGEVYEAVKYAILEAGYRHIDCAHAYSNEDEVGKALTEVISSGAVKREELFITSKLWCCFHSTGAVKPALETTLKNLGLDYLDLYLIHWPFGYIELGEIFPLDAAGKMQFSDIDYLDTWKGMEQVHEAGLAKSIGISNFNSEQTTRLLENAKVKPVVNQVESHPYLNQAELLAFSKERGIDLVAYSPLGSPDRPVVKADDPVLLDEPVLAEIAAKYGKSVAQVLLRFHVQRGVPVLAKSITPARIAANIQVFDFELSEEDLATLNALNKNFRLINFDINEEHKYYPFKIPF